MAEKSWWYRQLTCSLILTRFIISKNITTDGNYLALFSEGNCLFSKVTLSFQYILFLWVCPMGLNKGPSKIVWGNVVWGNVVLGKSRFPVFLEPAFREPE
jgi:hypothetical protein